MLTKEEVKRLLEEIVKKEDIINAIIEIDSGSKKGDGYLSEMTKVVVKNGNKKINLIIKCAPKSESFRQSIPLSLCYSREIFFYNVIFPAFQKFQKERSVNDPFKGAPKCYQTDIKEFSEKLILENIKENGFKHWDRTKQMDDAHVCIVLKEYAKFHAVSFAMQDQNKELYEELTKDLSDIGIKFDESMFNSLEIAMNDASELFISGDEYNIREMVKRFKYEIKSFFVFISEFRSKYNVINHGDCWSNNMMFRYKDNSNKPEEVCLLDFQILRTFSPVLDLAYFLYVSSGKETYNNLDHYLKFYHNVLKNQLNEMGSDVEQVFPYQALKNDWKKYSRYGFIVAVILLKNLLKEDDEIIDFNDAAKDDGDFLKGFLKESRHEDVAKIRIKELAVHLYENGFI